MIDLLVLKLGAGPDDVVAWGAFDNGALGEAGRAPSLASLTAVVRRYADDVRIVAVLPGEDVIARRIAAPPKSAARLLSAAMLIFEDDLATSVDETHIATLRAGDEARIFAVAKKTLRDWLDAFDAAEIRVSEASVDFACLGGASNAAIFALDGARIIAARGGVGFAAELDLAERVAPKFIAEAPEAPLIAYGAFEQVSRWSNAPVERRLLQPDVDLISIFGSHIAGGKLLPNFLNGEFKRKSARLFDFKQYRRVAAMGAALTLSLVFAGAAVGLRDARIAARYQKAAEALHKSAFPSFAGGDIRAHARAMLDSGQSSASLIDLSGRLAAGVKANEGVTVDRLRYDSARGQFVFSVRSATDAGIEGLRAALDQNGLVATDNGGVRRMGDVLLSEMSARPK